MPVITIEAMLREATTADIETLVAHHIAMFKEIVSLENKCIDDESFRRMAAAHTRKLNEQMPLRESGESGNVLRRAINRTGWKPPGSTP